MNSESPAHELAKDEQHQLLPHQQRVIEEFAQLTERIDKLTAFLAPPPKAIVEASELRLLTLQLHAMRVYQGLLEQRLMAWGVQL